LYEYGTAATVPEITAFCNGKCGMMKEKKKQSKSQKCLNLYRLPREKVAAYNLIRQIYFEIPITNLKASL
jgi:hypothetical protein